MPERGVRSTYSQCPFQIWLQDDSGLLSTGTAFLYTHSDQRYLITNWHNVSGRNFRDKSYMRSDKRVPTTLKAKWATKLVGPPEVPEVLFVPTIHDVALYTPDRKNVQWFEHPTLGSNCDVVAIPIVVPDVVPSFMHNSANLISRYKIPVLPGCVVFIIGFPQNLSVGFGLPIWKSGFIASEPHYDVSLGGNLAPTGGLQQGLNIPAFFVDSLTRSGMSGSPVFASYTGTWDTTDPYRAIDPDSPDFWSRSDVALGASAMAFVGIYSGRVPSKEMEAALGICWREDVIRLICERKAKGKHPHL